MLPLRECAAKPCMSALREPIRDSMLPGQRLGIHENTSPPIISGQQREESRKIWLVDDEGCCSQCCRCMNAQTSSPRQACSDHCSTLPRFATAECNMSGRSRWLQRLLLCQNATFKVGTCAILPMALVSFQRCMAGPGFTARLRGACMLERLPTLARCRDMACLHLLTALLDQAPTFDWSTCDHTSDV